LKLVEAEEVCLNCNTINCNTSRQAARRGFILAYGNLSKTYKEDNSMKCLVFSKPSLGLKH